ncbi:MAG: ATP-dependent DNA ligase [Sumerlaeia bacterium]
MRLFTRLYTELDETNRTTEKVAALERYFRAAEPEDAAWALWFLTGNRLPRGVNSRVLREWVAEDSGLPLWLMEECYGAVGDLAETAALLTPEPHPEGSDLPLHRVATERIRPLKTMEEADRRALLRRTWAEMNTRQRFVWHKLILGGFRVGVAKTLVVRALANVAGFEPAIMAHRVAGKWQPTAEDYCRIVACDDVAIAADPAQPYPFYLAYPLEDEVRKRGSLGEALGDLAEWQVEWKWDGIRAQLIRRAGQTILWSRGEELITERFPEIAEAARALPDGTVLDGEVLGWREGMPMPFGDLQKRITRKTAGPKIRRDVPVAFMAYDLMESEGEDRRGEPMTERRRRLEAVLAPLTAELPIFPSPVVEAESWEALRALREESRERRVEGFMLKRRDSPYRVGRAKGDWWKWKVEPYTADCVMIYAQRGHGRRASLYTDYTFGVWTDEGELVPVMKAYSGLTDQEIREVDRWIRQNTLESHGPVRIVKPERVMELAFEGLQESKRHKSGIATRFPRIVRLRDDKTAEEADTLASLQSLLAMQKGDS